MLGFIPIFTFDFCAVIFGFAEETVLTKHMMLALNLLDISMVANLVWLVSAGNHFVYIDDKYPATSGKRRPRALSHVSAGLLKEKMASSLVGVSSVHLLKVFLDISNAETAVNWQNVGALLGIHTMLIVGLVVFAYVNSMRHHNHPEEEKTEAKEETKHAETH
jgi:uncharacterized protein (TIGR00645 family)